MGEPHLEHAEHAEGDQHNQDQQRGRSPLPQALRRMFGGGGLVVGAGQAGPPLRAGVWQSRAPNWPLRTAVAFLARTHATRTHATPDANPDIKLALPLVRACQVAARRQAALCHRIAPQWASDDRHWGGGGGRPVTEVGGGVVDGVSMRGDEYMYGTTGFGGMGGGMLTRRPA